MLQKKKHRSLFMIWGNWILFMGDSWSLALLKCVIPLVWMKKGFQHWIQKCCICSIGCFPNSRIVSEFSFGFRIWCQCCILSFVGKKICAISALFRYLSFTFISLWKVDYCYMRTCWNFPAYGYQLMQMFTTIFR